MLWLVAGLIRAVAGSGELEGPGWRLAVDGLVGQGAGLGCAGGRWSAVLGIRRGLKLLVTGDSELPDAWIEAWAGEPGDCTDGVAVVEVAGTGPAIARIPLCSCGDRGCGNAGIQLRMQVAAGALPAVVAVLRALPWTGVVPGRSDVLRGGDLAALAARRGGAGDG
jgi:hypothetical protein